MVNKKRILILAIISIVCILICTALFCLFYEKVNKYEYADTSFFEMIPNLTSEEEKLNSPIEYKKEYLSIYSHYYFDESTDENDRNKFVTRSENILKYLSKNNYLAFEDKITCYLSDKLFNTYSQNKVHMTIDYKPMDLIICLLQSQQDDYLLYGFYYGVASEICKEINLKNFDAISGKTALKSYYKKDITTFYGTTPNMDTLDIEYPLFSPIYSDKDTLKISRGTAVQLVNHIYKQNELDKITDVLSFVTTDNMAALTNDWLHNKLKIDKSRTEYMGLKYFANSYNYTLNVKSPWFDMYFANDFYEPIIDNFEISYSNIKYAIGSFENDAAIIYKDFNLTENFVTEIYLVTDNGLWSGGMAIKDKITSTNCAIISHEYVHICYQKFVHDNIRHFAREAVPELYKVQYDDIFRLHRYSYYKGTCPALNTETKQLQEKVSNAYRRLYGEANYETLKINEIEHLIMYYLGEPLSEINALDSYWCYNSSLILYIEEIYGFEACYRLMMECNTNKVLGISDAQLKEDWWSYLENKYGD